MTGASQRKASPGIIRYRTPCRGSSFFSAQSRAPLASNSVALPRASSLHAAVSRSPAGPLLLTAGGNHMLRSKVRGEGK